MLTRESPEWGEPRRPELPERALVTRRPRWAAPGTGAELVERFTDADDEGWAVRPAARGFFLECGVDTWAWEANSKTSLRQKLRPVAERVLNRKGDPYWLRLRECGRPLVKMLSCPGGTPQFRLVYKNCGWMACPKCMARETRRLALQVRAFLRDRQEKLDEWVDDLDEPANMFRFQFVTLTQIKKTYRKERALAALKRLLKSWSVLIDGKGKYGPAALARAEAKDCEKAKLGALRRRRRRHRPGRQPAPGTKAWAAWVFATFYQGGLRKLEPTWSPKGEKGSDGHVVRWDGVHAHLHLILELREPADWWLDEIIEEEDARGCPWWGTRRQFIGGDAEDLWAEWFETARDCLALAWRIVSPVHESKAQALGIDVQALDDARAFQLVKYFMKPMSLDPKDSPASDYDPVDVAVDIYGAMLEKKRLVGFGTWDRWKKFDAGDVAPPEEVLEEWSCGLPLDKIIERARPVTFYKFTRIGEDVVKQTVEVPFAEVLAGLREWVKEQRTKPAREREVVLLEHRSGRFAPPARAGPRSRLPSHRRRS